MNTSKTNSQKVDETTKWDTTFVSLFLFYLKIKYINYADN